MEISIDVKSHVIITMQGSHLFINERLNAQLERMALDDMLTTPNGEQVKVSTIVEVLPISSYYEQYPDKRPAQRAENWTEQRITGNVFTRSKGDGRKLMLDAMKAKYPNASLVKLVGKPHRLGDRETQDYLSYLKETGRVNNKDAWEEFKKKTGIVFNN